MKRPLKGLSAIAGLIAASSVLIAYTERAAAETWRFYGTGAATHLFSKEMIASFARIDQRTGGQLKIQFVHYGETPHKATEALQILGDGLVQMTEWLPAYTTGTYPILAAPALPFLLPEFRDTGEAQVSADRAWDSPEMKEHVDRIVTKHRGKVLGSFYYEPMNFYFTKPFAKLEDFSGRRVRVFSPDQATLVRELGGTPISLSSAEVYGALQRGLLDGVITSSGSVTDLKWNEQLKSTFTTNMLMVRNSILVSQPALEGLPQNVRAVLEEEIAKVSANLRRIVTESDRHNHEVMKKAGFTFTTSQGELYQRLRVLSRNKVWPTWSQSAGADGAKVLDGMLASFEKK